jgi:hypothetical protein
MVLATWVTGCGGQGEPPAIRSQGSQPSAGMGEGDLSPVNPNERNRSVTTRPMDSPVRDEQAHHPGGITDSEVAD